MTPSEYERQRMRAYDSHIHATNKTGKPWREILKQAGLLDLPGKRKKRGHHDY